MSNITDVSENLYIAFFFECPLYHILSKDFHAVMSVVLPGHHSMYQFYILPLWYYFCKNKQLLRDLWLMRGSSKSTIRSNSDAQLVFGNIRRWLLCDNEMAANYWWWLFMLNSSYSLILKPNLYQRHIKTTCSNWSWFSHPIDFIASWNCIQGPTVFCELISDLPWRVIKNRFFLYCIFITCLSIHMLLFQKCDFAFLHLYLLSFHNYYTEFPKKRYIEYIQNYFILHMKH